MPNSLERGSRQGDAGPRLAAAHAGGAGASRRPGVHGWCCLAPWHAAEPGHGPGTTARLRERGRCTGDGPLPRQFPYRAVPTAPQSPCPLLAGLRPDRLSHRVWRRPTYQSGQCTSRARGRRREVSACQGNSGGSSASAHGRSLWWPGGWRVVALGPGSPVGGPQGRGPGRGRGPELERHARQPAGGAGDPGRCRAHVSSWCPGTCGRPGRQGTCGSGPTSGRNGTRCSPFQVGLLSCAEWGRSPTCSIGSRRRRHSTW